MKPLNWYHT